MTKVRVNDGLTLTELIQMAGIMGEFGVLIFYGG